MAIGEPSGVSAGRILVDQLDGAASIILDKQNRHQERTAQRDATAPSSRPTSRAARSDSSLSSRRPNEDGGSRRHCRPSVEARTTPALGKEAPSKPSNVTIGTTPVGQLNGAAPIMSIRQNHR